MEYIGCILVSVILSSIYTRLTLTKYDEIITEHIKNTGEVTFDAVMELLKKIGVMRQ